jgi:hypothetical protein
MRTHAFVFTLSGTVIAASSALFACGSGDDSSPPVPHFDGSAEGSSDATMDVSPEGSSPDGSSAEGGDAGTDH